MSDEGLLVEYRRNIPNKALPIVFGLVGLGLAIGGLVTLGSVETPVTALLFAFGGLGLVTAIAVWLDIAKKTRLDERTRVFGDRIEIATSAGVTRYPFSELKSLEGKVMVFQQTGARIHAYKLAFAGGSVEISGGELAGVNEQTGSLLAARTGHRIEPWL